MADNIISYLEMCRREGTSLQAGMNFGLGGIIRDSHVCSAECSVS